MIKVENIEAWGFAHAIRGMRNPLESHARSDSGYTKAYGEYQVGEADLGLMWKLYKAGTEHRKYLRQIFVSMDITAPLYWWKEMSTYKVGTTANSCSTMHTIHKKPFTESDFSIENLIPEVEDPYAAAAIGTTISALNRYRELFLKEGDKKYWWQMIQLLPSSYNQKRTLTMNYENAVSIIRQRSGHKLDEWRSFISVLMGLPYLKDIMEG